MSGFIVIPPNYVILYIIIATYYLYFPFRPEKSGLFYYKNNNKIFHINKALLSIL